MKEKILVTCPPMLGMKEQFLPIIENAGFEAICPEVTQTLTEDEIIELLPECVGWIIGDDPATRRVFEAGKMGKLRAAVKWGIGVDNVDFDACKDLSIPISNTPDMFGAEVADIALGYVIALARETFEIDRAVREGKWIKPRGISLSGKNVALIGFGDIGKSTAKRLLALDMNVVAYDPFAGNNPDLPDVKREVLPVKIEEADFIVITSSLTKSSFHLVNADIFNQAKEGVRVVNVGRGPVIDETSLEDALRSGKVYSAALDVFEVEPLPKESYLHSHPRCVFGSHNASNTSDAVSKTNDIAVDILINFLQSGSYK